MTRIPLSIVGSCYVATVRHDGLHKFRHIRGKDGYVVQQKALAQMSLWDEQWRKRSEREGRTLEREACKDLAAERTREAEAEIEGIRAILRRTLSVNDRIDWETLKDATPFPAPEPVPPGVPPVPRQPERPDMRYILRSDFLDLLVPGRRRRKVRQLQTLFDSDWKAWHEGVTTLKDEFVAARSMYEKDLEAWNAARDGFVLNQQAANGAIDRDRAAYLGGDSAAVVDYCDLVLTRSQYPDAFPQEFELEYNQGTRTLVVDYALPRIEDLPKIKAVKYVQARDEMQEISLTESALQALYDDALYQIAIRTIHELFEADAISAIECVVFNGWVTSIDPRTGNEANACILSIQASKGEFLALHLHHIEPKACFKSLKGVGSSKLHSLTPIAPILTVSREDSRFVSSYSVAGAVEEGDNLAAMDWEDFEHLVRELFEMEFASSGGEVKVTRASRDGGVDAVAFDPDPVRGGKIVIQAKRYVNTVGVGAVRDLYGTVMNEGAMKGILVTTSDYGPDAYEFARDKPLTLLNGSNLLHMLAQHGHKARIDLREARALRMQRDPAG